MTATGSCAMTVPGEVRIDNLVVRGTVFLRGTLHPSDTVLGLYPLSSYNKARIFYMLVHTVDRVVGSIKNARLFEPIIAVGA